MAHPKLFSFLLLAAICLPFLSVPNVSSQSGTVTTATTIQTPPAGQCSLLSLPFTAPVRSVLSGEFSTDAPVDFYILSQTDFTAFTQAGTCQLPATVNPLFSSFDTTGAYNQYTSMPISTNGTYLYVFVYRNAGLSHLTSGYATISLSYPSSVTFQTATSHNTVVMTFSTVTSSTTPEFPIWTILLDFIILIGLVGLLLRRKLHSL